MIISFTICLNSSGKYLLLYNFLLYNYYILLLIFFQHLSHSVFVKKKYCYNMNFYFYNRQNVFKFLKYIYILRISIFFIKIFKIDNNNECLIFFYLFLYYIITFFFLFNYYINPILILHISLFQICLHFIEGVIIFFKEM